MDTYEYESVLLVKNEVFVFKIPPRTTSRGYRASDWNLQEPQWTGRMRLLAKGSECYIKLEDKAAGQLFAKCPVEAYPGVAIEPVTDSSRYFVLRIQDDNGRTAFIGLGFGDRSDSFDLNVALQDHFKHLRKEKEAEDVPLAPGQDYSFKEGETIKINMKITVCKTLLARAVAHHTECTFIRVSGSELVQKFIGEGSRMVRELFVMAREHAPSIIFMDEIDSIGSSRIESGSSGDSEVQRTMLELLNQLDGFEATKNIKVIMATNRIDILDPALLRPGRIDRKIEFPPPNEEARLDILKIHSRKMNLTRGINLRKIAELMPGASGAEVKGVCTEAGMYALRERRVHVTQEDFEMAVAKVMQKDSEKNMSMKKLWK